MEQRCGRITRARAAYDAMVDDRTAVDCDLQAVVGVVVLGRLVIRVKLQRTQRTETVTEKPLIQLLVHVNQFGHF